MAQPGPSGLSQRRRPAGGAANGSSSNTHSDDFGYGGVSPHDSPSSKQGFKGTIHVLAGSSSGSGGIGSGAVSTTAGPGGHRIAYDPRDLKDEDEESRHPRLTLMEECLLLGLKDRQGYLSFWNDSISYALRGCIILELLLRRRLSIVKDAHRIRLDVQDRLLEVINPKMTGEVLLDEALKLIKSSDEKRSVAEWIDLLSGETWNLAKIGYQLKQVRERLAKGLVDKGILRTEKRNFLLFDMATHPIADASAKKDTLRRVHALCCGTSTRSLARLYPDTEDVVAPTTRALALVCCAFAANVLDNALLHLTYEARETTFQKIEEWMEAFGAWPMASKQGGITGSSPAAAAFSGGNGTRSESGGARIAEGSVLPEPDAMGGMPSPGLGGASMGLSTNDLAREIRSEAAAAPDGMFEGIAAVIAVLARMDSLL